MKERNDKTPACPNFGQAVYDSTTISNAQTQDYNPKLQVALLDTFPCAERAHTKRRGRARAKAPRGRRIYTEKNMLVNGSGHANVMARYAACLFITEHRLPVLQLSGFGCRECAWGQCT